MRRLIILTIISVVFLFLVDRILANPPHRSNWTADSNKKVYCNSCHRMHNAVGPGLTRDINATLCMSCHSSTASSAPEKPFQDADQADFNASTGNSHRWDNYLPLNDSANNDYGLRPVDYLWNTFLKRAALKFKNPDGAGGVTCSTCHWQHNHTQLPWDPYYGPASNTPTGSTGYSGTATGGSETTIEDTLKAWTTNQWANSLVVISGPTSSSNYNKERRVVSNNPNTLTVSPAFSTIVSSPQTYSITSGRHYQRVTNTECVLCGDCHYYRWTTTETDVRTYSGYKKSHPIGKSLTTVADPTQFVGAAPFEPSSANWAWQIESPRYAGNGGSDNNSTNNIVLDSNSRVRCLSCHGIHYTDSDSSTEDRSHDDRMP